MRFFLDTNTCIDALRGRLPAFPDRLQKLAPSAVKIPAMVQAELLFGAEKSRDRERTLEIVERFLFPFEIVPFDARAAVRYAAIRTALESKGKIIGPNDLIIAATVLSRDATLVTHNTREFRRVPGLRCEDWASGSR